MAVIQISKIQVRRGYGEDLPQLASGELGWSIDERRLFIGNGTLSEGAPEIGNTEILTIYSPIGAALANIAVIESEITVLQGNVANLEASVGAPITVDLANYNSVASSANITLTTPTSIIDYKISRATGNALATSYRVGTLTSTNLNGIVSYQDDYTETADTGIVLSVIGNSGNTANIYYTSTSATYPAKLTYYSIRKFS
jgi:Major tropism determinant N-terminal domain